MFAGRASSSELHECGKLQPVLGKEWGFGPHMAMIPHEPAEGGALEPAKPASHGHHDAEPAAQA